mgnify:CR=1 FL=1
MYMKQLFISALLIALLAAGCNSNGNRQAPDQATQKTEIQDTEARKIDAEQFFKDSINRVDQLIKECTPEANLLYVNYIFTDIDNDGVEEMYLKENMTENEWLFCCGAGYVELVAYHDDHFELFRSGNYISMSGHFPSGFAVDRYYELKDSHVIGPDFMEVGQMNWETGVPDMHFCVADHPDSPYPGEKAGPFMEKLQKHLENSGWEALDTGIEGYMYTPFGFLNGMIGEEPDPEEMEDTEQ